MIKDSLYWWGEDENDLPRPFVNDSKDMRNSASTVDIFHLSTFDSERALITGNLPEGVMGYACTSIENNLLYFGGSCKPLDCYHNNLNQLNSLTNNREEIVSISPDNEPTRKRGCGMININTNGEYNLLVLGGFGPTPITAAVNFQ